MTDPSPVEDWQAEWARKAVEAVRRGERVQMFIPKGAVKRRIIAEAKALDELLDRTSDNAAGA